MKNFYLSFLNFELKKFQKYVSEVLNFDDVNYHNVTPNTNNKD
jgi:hypothetical protein